MKREIKFRGMKDLKDYNGREISHFNNDTEQVSYNPNKKGKMILQVERYKGKFGFIDKVYILHIDKNGNEMCRYDALSPSVTSIYWKEVEE